MIGPEGERPTTPVDGEGGGSTAPGSDQTFDPAADPYIDPLTGKEWRSRQLQKWGLGCPEGDFLADLSIEDHVKIADTKILYPGAPAKVIGEMLGHSEAMVK